MQIFSKMVPWAAHVTCQEMVHQNTDNCFLASLDMLLASAVGSAKFFSIIYLAQLLLRLRATKNRREAIEGTKILKNYSKSVIYGISSGTVFIASNCILRRVLGRYTNYTCCFWSAYVAALSIFLESPLRRSIVITSYAQLTLNLLLRRTKELNILSWSKNQKTILFMILQTVLFYLLKYVSDDFYWFYTPDKYDSRKNLEGNFINKAIKIVKTAAKYFGAGITLHFVRTMIAKPNIKNVIQFWSLKNSKLGIFFAMTVFIYEIVEISSAQRFPDKNKVATLVAGFLAGTAYFINPSDTILTACAAGVLHILLKQCIRSNKLPKYTEEFLFLAYNGYLYHARAMNPTAAPGPFINIMSVVTSKRSDFIYKYYEGIVNGGENKFD